MSISSTTQECDVTTHQIIQFSLYWDNLPSGQLQEDKNNRKFETFSSKKSQLLKGGGRLQEVTNIVIWLITFWYFG